MRKDNDPRWRGVSVPSFHSVMLRTLGEDESYAELSGTAWDLLKAGDIWREYEAVWHPNKAGQIIGYRKVNPKAWFILTGHEVEGPFPSKTICLSKLRTKTSNKVRSGVYTATCHEGRGHTIFTRDEAAGLGLERSKLP